MDNNNNEEINASVLPNEIIDIITEISQEESTENLDQEEKAKVGNEQEATVSSTKNISEESDVDGNNTLEDQKNKEEKIEDVVCIEDDDEIADAKVIDDEEVKEILKDEKKSNEPVLIEEDDDDPEEVMDVSAEQKLPTEDSATATELQTKNYDLQVAKNELENIIAKVDTVFQKHENKDNTESKKKNLLGLIRKIKPNSAPLGDSIPQSNITSTSSTINKRKSSPPIFHSYTFQNVTHNGLLKRQTIASATVPTQQVLGKTVVKSPSIENSNLRPKVESPITIADSPTDELKEAEHMDLDTKAGDDFSDNIFGHMLDFMYKGLMSRAANQSIPNPQGGSDDPSLEMPEIMKSGVQVLVDCMQKGSESLKHILTQEVDTILECRRCKGLFRSIPNLVKHKKMFCKASGSMTKLLNKMTNCSADENKSLKNLLNILNPQDNAEEVVDLRPISSNPNARFQKMVKPSAPPAVSKIVFSKGPANITSSFTPAKPYNGKQTNSTFTAKTTPQYIILNQGKGQLSRGHLKTNPAATTFTNHHHPSPNVMITTSGRIGALTNSLNSKVDMDKANLKLDKFSSAVVKVSSNSNTPVHTLSNLQETRKKPKCPICNKIMAERKNVKRHLVHVHMLSVQEAWKLMHKTMPLPTTSSKHKSVTDMKQSTEELRKSCVEIMEVGPHREVKVLPKTYSFPDSFCPVCAKAISSRNNVRRHMLESHDFLIEGDKKYYQLKLLLTKSDGVLDGTNKSMRQFYGTSSSMDIDTIKAQLEAIEAYKRNEMMESKIPLTLVPKVTIIKHTEPTLKIEELQETSEPELSKSEAKKLIDAALCKCLSCSEEFCRRQNLRSHMVQTHKWSLSLFNSVYDDAYNKKSDDDESESEEESRPAQSGSASKTLQSLSKLANQNADDSAKKVVILHKIVSAPGVVSSSTPTVMTSKIGGNSAGGSLIPSGGIYVMKTGVQIIPQRTTTTVVSEIGTKRKQSTDNGRDNFAAYAPVTKKEKLFDIKNNLCCLCNQEFESTSLLKRHMIEVHSCTMEQVLGASRDSKHVNPEVQKYGESMGYDIENAKCLVCSKYFFVRHALKKHLNKVHSFKYATLQGLESEPEESYDSDDNSKTDKKPYVSLPMLYKLIFIRYIFTDIYFQLLLH